MHPDTQVARAFDDPVVSALDLDAFGPEDLLNLVLQRSEILWDLPRSGRLITAWSEGDAAPLTEAVATLGSEIARRAAAVIRAEYLALRPLLETLPMGRVADIGCGYALFDLFVAQDFGSELLLIDLESNERRHFGFEAEGAAYSSLAVARRLLEANGIRPEAIRTLNPGAEEVTSSGPVDLAVSFLSCGFHYPAALYRDYFTTCVRPGGAVILDLRARAAWSEPAIAVLSPLGRLDEIAGPPKTRRVLLRREAVAA